MKLFYFFQCFNRWWSPSWVVLRIEVSLGEQQLGREGAMNKSTLIGDYYPHEVYSKYENLQSEQATKNIWINVPIPSNI